MWVNAITRLADNLAPKAPFVTTYAGALTLALAGAIFTFLFAYFPRWRKETRESQTAQIVLMTRITEALWPNNTKAMVERVHDLEYNLNAVAREVENNDEISRQQLQAMKDDIAAIKQYLGDELIDDARERSRRRPTNIRER